MAKRIRSKIEKAVDAEFEAKTKEELLADFDQSQALHVPAKKRESKLISIRLPMSMMKELRDLAIKKGDVGYQQLIKIFISEGLSRSPLETSSHTIMWPSRFRLGDRSNLDSLSICREELQPSLSKTGGRKWK